MNFPDLPILGNFINFILGLPPIILIPLLVIVVFLLIRGVINIIFAQAKSAAGAILVLILVIFVCTGGIFLFSKMPNILSAVEKIFSPIFHF